MPEPAPRVITWRAQGVTGPICLALPVGIILTSVDVEPAIDWHLRIAYDGRVLRPAELRAKLPTNLMAQPSGTYLIEWENADPDLELRFSFGVDLPPDPSEL